VKQKHTDNKWVFETKNKDIQLDDRTGRSIRRILLMNMTMPRFPSPLPKMGFLATLFLLYMLYIYPDIVHLYFLAMCNWIW